MKVTASAVLLLATTSLVSSLSIRSTRYSKDAISRRESEPEARVLSGPLSERFYEELLNHLEKRRGGGGSGGGGGGGGRSGSSSGSSGSSSGGSSGGAAGGAAGGSRSTGSASSSSSANRGYGGGAYYGGGSSGAYRAGGRSPLGILPFALGGAALGFFPGLWLYGAYAYPYSHPYGFRNQTNNQNESLPIQCLCAQYSACGCDDNNNSTFLDSIIGNGSASDEDSTLVHIGDVNGTKTLIINGTLPNGTDNSTTAAPTSTASSAATRQIVENSGFWVMGSIVGATVWLL